MRQRVKRRVILNLLAIGLCLMLIYVFLGSPVLTPRSAFRRAEKANLVGPGEILAVLTPKDQAYSHLVLARDGGAVMLYAWDMWNGDLCSFVYLESGEDLILAAGPGKDLLWTMDRASLPLVLFDQLPEAVRGELMLTIEGSFQGQPCSFTGAFQAHREGDGYFAFELVADDPLGGEGYCLHMLRNAISNPRADVSGFQIQAELRLYDSDGDLAAREIKVLSEG